MFHDPMSEQHQVVEKILPGLHSVIVLYLDGEV